MTGTWRTRAAILVGILAVVAAGWFLVWASDVARPDANGLAAMASDNKVTVLRDEWIDFQPVGANPAVGLIFYPGGKADPVAYAPVLRRIAAAGYLVVAVPMPLNLSMLASNRAAAVQDAYPAIRHWVIAGHSLGGVSAVGYVRRHPASMDGLLLWASYPAAGDDISGLDLPVTSIYGTADQFATTAKIDAGKARLPAGTEYVAVPGGDHFQFGSFRDVPVNASIARDEEQAAILAASLALLARVGAAAPPAS